MEHSGLVHMIRNNQTKDLLLLYGMFTRRTNSFELLRRYLSQYIVDEGHKIILDERLKNEELVIRLIELNQRIKGIMLQSMQKDSRVDMTIKMAFEKVVNVNQRTAKALVAYLDEMFKKEIKTI